MRFCFFVFCCVFSIHFAQQTRLDNIALFDWRELDKDLSKIFATYDSEKNSLDSPICDDRLSEENGTTSALSQFSLCRCDSRCIEFGDCCFHETRKKIGEKKAKFFSKRSCRRWNDSMYLYMVDKCPEKVTKENSDNEFDVEDIGSRLIREKCHKTNFPHSYHSDLPVHSLATNTTYANVFCSLCHGENLPDLSPFKVSVQCNNRDLIRRCGLDVVSDLMRDEDYVQGELRWSRYMKGREFRGGCSGGASYPISCQLSILHENYEASTGLLLPGARSCLNHRAVDSCDTKKTGTMSQNTRRRFESFCTIYGLVVVSAATNEIYKNPHCAACNGLAMNDTKVATFEDIFTLSREELGFLGDYFNSAKTTTKTSLIRREDDFEVEYDFSLDVCQLMESEEGRLQFFDALYGECYNVTCGLLYENVGGDCQYRNITKSQFNIVDDSRDSEEECFMVTLQPWELRQGALQGGKNSQTLLETIFACIHSL